ncbi:hypothetical protein HUA74_40735 [Myxococcus sp. CA051A]|uniref:hypothetical protein n=1 Tax=Myxococcus sp. CA051A TaxID=2741739 RepID=UPI00157B653D|nr:hypothetical protein [Myxococcus sp. CA051A]NTX16769.1 hypothetical protein [Myxococcus sp. CA056]NTX66997.1 hypothetical protein [Myxococcus sp. CA051A]
MSLDSRRFMSRLCLLLLSVWSTAALATEEYLQLATCLGPQQQTYSPALKLLPRQTYFSAEATLNVCVTLDPALSSARFQVAGGGVASCTLASLQSRIVLEWNTGETSIIDMSSPLDLKPLGQTVVPSYGTVISGRFEGALVVSVLELTPNDLALLKCLTTGVTESSGLISMTFLQLLP